MKFDFGVSGFHSGKINKVSTILRLFRCWHSRCINLAQSFLLRVCGWAMDQPCSPTRRVEGILRERGLLDGRWGYKGLYRGYIGVLLG